MAPLPAHVLAPLTRRFQANIRTIGERSTPHLQKAWRELDSYHEDDVETFTRAADPVLSAAKLAAVRQAVGYYSLAAGVRPRAIVPAEIPVHFDVRDPFISVWSALKNGAPLEVAIEAGSNRTDALVRDLVTSSARQTGDAVVARSDLRVIGWERIPEGNACPWCIEVAGQTYASAETADFGHDRCGCSASPIYAA